MAKHLYFSNKKRCLSINEKANQHLFIRYEEDGLFIQVFNEGKLFNPIIERGKFVDFDIKDIKGFSFHRAGGLLWLSITLKIDDLVISPKSWLDDRYFKLITKFNELHKIQNMDAFEKHIYKNKYLFKDTLFLSLIGENNSLVKFRKYLGEFYYTKLRKYMFKKRQYLLKKKFYYLDGKYEIIDKIVSAKDINEFNQYFKNL